MRTVKSESKANFANAHIVEFWWFFTHSDFMWNYIWDYKSATSDIFTYFGAMNSDIFEFWHLLKARIYQN